LDLLGRTRAPGGKLFAKSLAKNFKTLIFIKQNLIMSRCEHGRAEQGSARALPLTRKFLEKFEKPFFKKVFQENPNAN